MSTIKLNGSIRAELGSGASSKLRKKGLIPAVIYNDKGENIYITVEARAFNREFLKGNIQIRPIEIEIGDKIYKVLVYGLETHPVKDTPIHIDFLNTEGKKEVKVSVPVNFTGREKALGLKRGGFLNIIKRTIQLWCDPENIPSKITVNVSKLHIGEALSIDKINLPKETRTVNKKNFVVASITGRGKSMEEEKKPVEGVEGAPVEGGAEVKPAEGKAEVKPEAKKEKK